MDASGAIVLPGYISGPSQVNLFIFLSASFIKHPSHNTWVRHSQTTKQTTSRFFVLKEDS